MSGLLTFLGPMLLTGVFFVHTVPLLSQWFSPCKKCNAIHVMRHRESCLDAPLKTKKGQNLKTNWVTKQAERSVTWKSVERYK